MRQLTDAVKGRGVDSRWCLEKSDLIQLYDRLQQASHIDPVWQRHAPLHHMHSSALAVLGLPGSLQF